MPLPSNFSQMFPKFLLTPSESFLLSSPHEMSIYKTFYATSSEVDKAQLAEIILELCQT